MKRKRLLSFLFLLTIIVVLSQPTMSQNLTVDVGGDLVSRYIWRGLNVNDEVNIQPYLTFS